MQGKPYQRQHTSRCASNASQALSITRLLRYPSCSSSSAHLQPGAVEVARHATRPRHRHGAEVGAGGVQQVLRGLQQVHRVEVVPQQLLRHAPHARAAVYARG